MDVQSATAHGIKTGLTVAVKVHYSYSLSLSVLVSMLSMHQVNRIICGWRGTVTSQTITMEGFGEAYKRVGVPGVLEGTRSKLRAGYEIKMMHLLLHC